MNETTSVYLGVTGVDELYAVCRERGATITTPLTDQPWGLRDFVVEIPGGHKLAIGERISLSPGQVSSHRLSILRD